MAFARTTNACRGFTLVELLVALTIMAVVAGLLTNSMQFSLKTVDAVESSIATSVSTHQAQRALKRQLQQALPIRRTDSDGGEKLEFAATRKEVQFVAPLPGLASGGGLYRISLRVEDATMLGSDSGKLLMTYRSFMEDSEFNRNSEEPREVVLLEGFSDAEFSFLDSLRRTASSDWAHEWRHDDRLPDLVRLHIDFNNALDDDDLDLILAIKATSPAGYGTS